MSADFSVEQYRLYLRAKGLIAVETNASRTRSITLTDRGRRYVKQLGERRIGELNALAQSKQFPLPPHPKNTSGAMSEDAELMTMVGTALAVNAQLRVLLEQIESRLRTRLEKAEPSEHEELMTAARLFSEAALGSPASEQHRNGAPRPALVGSSPFLNG